MAKLRGALIGCGGRGLNHAGGYVDVDAAELVAGADNNPTNLNRFKERFPGVPTHDSAEELLEREKPDIVSIVTKEHFRHGLVMMAVEAGVKAIMAEKPMARTLADASEMVEACEKEGVLLTISHQMRFCPEFEEAHRVVEAGEIGQPLFVRASSNLPLMDQGTHIVDMMLWMTKGAKAEWVMGQVDDVESWREKCTHPAPPWTVGYVNFEGGLRGNFETGRENVPPPIESDLPVSLRKRVEVIGTDGYLDAVVAHYCKVFGKDGLRVLESSRADWDAATPRFVAEICQVLAQGGEHRCNAREALRGLEIMYAALESAMQQKAIHLPLPRESDPLSKILPGGAERP